MSLTIVKPEVSAASIVVGADLRVVAFHWAMSEGLQALLVGDAYDQTPELSPASVLAVKMLAKPCR